MMMISRTTKELEEQRIAVYLCGGSLIHYQVVLTVGHCVCHNLETELRAMAGEWKLQRDMYPHLNRSVAEVLFHPEHKKGYLHNDVALLFLDYPFQPNEAIQPVCLPPPDANFDHQTCFSTVWGRDRKLGSHKSILKKMELPIVPNDQCQSAHRNTSKGPEYTLHKSYICAGGLPGKYMCQLDDGSPLVCQIPNKQHQYYQTGIVVWGECGEDNLPDSFTNVAMFRNWIDQQMIQHNFSTSSYTPQEATILD